MPPPTPSTPPLSPFPSPSTALFLAYIALALYLSLALSRALSTELASLPRIHRSRALRVAVALKALGAAAAFGLLAWCMSAFLGAHFVDARARAREGGGMWGGVRRWVCGSSFFTDFARQVVGSEQGFRWGGAGLAGGLVGNVYIAMVAQSTPHPSSTLLPVLAQILPTGFAVALASIAYSIAAAPYESETRRLPRARTTSSTGALLGQLLLLGSFALFLFFLRANAHAEPARLLGLVGLARAFLLIPHLGFVPVGLPRWRFSSFVVGIAAVAAVQDFPDSLVWLWKTTDLNGAWAVKALGWDLILLVPSAVMFDALDPDVRV